MQILVKQQKYKCSLHKCMLLNHFGCFFIESLSVVFVQRRSFSIEGIIGIRFIEETCNGEKNLRNAVNHLPFSSQNIQTRGSGIGIDVGVIDFGGEFNGGWLEWILSWEDNVEFEGTTLIRGIHGTQNRRLPLKEVVPRGTRGAQGWRLLLHFLQVS